MEITIKVRNPRSVRNTVLSTSKCKSLRCNDFPHESTILVVSTIPTNKALLLLIHVDHGNKVSNHVVTVAGSFLFLTSFQTETILKSNNVSLVNNTCCCSYNHMFAWHYIITLVFICRLFIILLNYCALCRQGSAELYICYGVYT